MFKKFSLTCLSLLSKSIVVEAKAMSACLDTYPGYTGDIDVTDGSKVIVVFGSEIDGLTFKYNLKGIEENCVDCGVHIHTGTTCDDASLVGGHYWDADSVPDPWVPAYGAVYSTDNEGFGKANFTVDSGYGYDDNLGRAVVVHASDGTRVGCGVLSKGRLEAKTCLPEKSVLETCLGVYPDYTGALADVKGKIKVRYFHENIVFQYNLKSADTSCTDCGIHIHAGTTCDDASLVLGHYWDSHNGTTADPWTSAYGAVYSTNSNGKGKGKFRLNAGYDVSENLGHAVVVHDKDGTRYACGVLGDTEVSGCLA